MIGVVGLSHKSAPIEIREKFALDKTDIVSISEKLRATTQIEEMVLISTCNRTEIYFKAPKCCASGAFSIVRRVLNSYTGTDESLETYLYKYQHEDAVKHLFRVVSSLDSMVLGEYQIVSQIKDAYELAKQNHTAGKILKRLFIKALETGKEVRTQTEISKGAFSVSYAAVEKCYEHHKDLSHKKILLIGAGETGELVIKNLHNKGCKHITVTNRTLDRAEELAHRYHGRAVPFADMAEQVMEADIVVSSIAAKSAILSTANVTGNGHAQLFIDLGVPRNIDNSIACLPQVTLVNIDNLHEVVSGNKEKKHAFVQAANDIIDIKSQEFTDWLNAQNLAPTIQTIISNIKTTSQNELSVFKKFHSSEELELMNKYGDHLSEKLIKALVKNLKNISDNGRKTEYIKVVNDLFNPSNEPENH
jgi:glutamyl-tRNA reductase